MISRISPVFKMLHNHNSSKLGRESRHPELFLLPFSHIKKEEDLITHLSTRPPRHPKPILLILNERTVQEGCNNISNFKCNNTMMTEEDSISTNIS